MIPAPPPRPSWWLVCRSRRLLAALAMAWVVFAVGAGGAAVADPVRTASPQVTGVAADAARRIAVERPDPGPAVDRAVPDERPRVHRAASAARVRLVTPTVARCAEGAGPEGVWGSRAPPVRCHPAGPSPAAR